MRREPAARDDNDRGPAIRFPGWGKFVECQSGPMLTAIDNVFLSGVGGRLGGMVAAEVAAEAKAEMVFCGWDVWFET